MNASSRWRNGDGVLARGERWTVLEETPFTDCAALRLAGAGRLNAGRIRTLLTPFDRLRPLLRRASWRVVRPRRWLHAVRRITSDVHPFGGLRAAAATGVDLLPYQLEPALAMSRHGASRVLIADAVGLGKTIQAGLILRETAASSDTVRVLILVPAGLRDQWRRELEQLFGLSATTADAAWLKAVAREIPPDVNPWALPGILISSFDFVKRPEVLRPLEEVIWDLVIADEVHGAALSTNRHAAVDAVASRARRVVLLTATPHSGDVAQFESICRIGAAGRDAPIVMFRRSRDDTSAAIRRRTTMLSVAPSEAERRMHRLLERYTNAVCRAAHTRDDSRARLAAIVLRKRALSSAGSLAASVRRRMDLLAGAADAGERQLPLPLSDEDPLPDAPPDAALAAPGLADAARERRWLSAIAQAAHTAAASESKTIFLLRLLRRIREPAIVFTEYRDTLARLRGAVLGMGLRVQVLHGGMPPAERTEAQRHFNETPSLLLASDAASEGLNLHTRCRLVIHYELPWSPARLQQRAGRVDRIGQRRTVHEIMLVSADTAERVVLAPLLRRAARARVGQEAGGVLALLTESRVAAAVMDGIGIDQQTERTCEQAFARCTTRLDLRHEAEVEAARLRLQRDWSSASARKPPRARPDDGFLATVLKPGRRVAVGTLLYKVSVAAEDGSLVHAEIVPVEFDVANEPAGPRRWTRGQLRAAARTITHAYDPIARRLLQARFSVRVADVMRRHALALEAQRHREAAIAQAAPGTARRLVQPGLFDRRALRHAAARQRAAGARLDAASERLGVLHAAGHLTASVEIVGLLLRPSHIPE